MNEELASELVNEIGGGKSKFFECNVLETESVASAVNGAAEWAQETGKKFGGVIAAAGVATPARVSFSIHFLSLTEGGITNRQLVTPGATSHQQKCGVQSIIVQHWWRPYARLPRHRHYTSEMYEKLTKSDS